MQYVSFAGAIYSFLCLCFLAFRLRSFAASQLLGYVAVIFYLFVRELLHGTNPPLYELFATFRAVVFLAPYFMWTSARSLLGKRAGPKQYQAIILGTALLGAFDALYVQRPGSRAGAAILEGLAVLAPLAATAFAAREVHKFGTARLAAFPSQPLAPIGWLYAFVWTNFFLALCFLADEALAARGFGFRYLGLSATASMLFGFILFAAKNGMRFFDDATIRSVDALNAPDAGPAVPEAVRLELQRKLDLALGEEQVFLDPDLDLSSLAAHLKEPPEVLAGMIRRSEHKTLKNLVNQHRVRYCMDVMRAWDEKQNILDLAFAAGFNSKATFYRYFDKVAGCSPTDFLAASTAKR